VNDAVLPDVSIADVTEAPADWSAFLRNARGAGFFHGAAWTEAVCRHVPGLRPVWLTARTTDGRLLGGLVAVRRSRGALVQFDSSYDGTSGGPLVSAELPETAGRDLVLRLLRRYAQLARRPTATAAFNFGAEQERDCGELIRAAGWRPEPITAALLPLSGGIDHVEMNVFKKNRRNERNRSLKRGCSADVTTDPQLLAEYYPIYEAAARHWRITPTPFGLLRDLLVDTGGAAFLSYVRYEGRVIGGHVNFHWGDRVTAWNGATRPEHNDKFPATLLIWTDIVESCRRQASWLDLGASGGIPSLESFKKLLGARQETRVRYVRSGWAYDLMRRAARLLRRGRSPS
jgi:CelD/BcsL family acetyltransferase involved in cellulose biosynthesis